MTAESRIVYDELFSCIDSLICKKYLHERNLKQITLESSYLKKKMAGTDKMTRIAERPCRYQENQRENENSHTVKQVIYEVLAQKLNGDFSKGGSCHLQLML